MILRYMYAVRKRGTDLWAPFQSGWPVWGSRDEAQVYRMQNQATARANAIKKYNSDDSGEVVKLKVTIVDS